MARKVKAVQETRVQYINDLLLKMGRSAPIKDYRADLFADSVIAGIPDEDGEWFAAWIIKMIDKTFGLCSLESDIVLMRLRLLDGFQDLNLTDRYDKFLLSSSYLETVGEKREKSLRELKDDPQEYKRIKNNFNHKVSYSIGKLAEKIAKEIPVYREKGLDSLDGYMEEFTDESGKAIKVAMKCRLRNPAQKESDPFTRIFEEPEKGIPTYKIETFFNYNDYSPRRKAIDKGIRFMRNFVLMSRRLWYSLRCYS